MSRVDELRKKELTKLKKQRTLAIERLTQCRTDHPEINTPGWEYLDGSYRGDINDTGGFPTPSHHMWEVGCVDGRDVYVYEEVDWQVWHDVHTRAQPAQLDTGRYALAVSDRSTPMYHNQGIYIGKVDDKSLDKIDWSIDTIIAITDLLKRFYTPKDAARRIKAKQTQYS